MNRLKSLGQTLWLSLSPAWRWDQSQMYSWAGANVLFLKIIKATHNTHKKGVRRQSLISGFAYTKHTQDSRTHMPTHTPTHIRLPFEPIPHQRFPRRRRRRRPSLTVNEFICRQGSSCFISFGRFARIQSTNANGNVPRICLCTNLYSLFYVSMLCWPSRWLFSWTFLWACVCVRPFYVD